MSPRCEFFRSEFMHHFIFRKCEFAFSGIILRVFFDGCLFALLGMFGEPDFRLLTALPIRICQFLDCVGRFGVPTLAIVVNV